MAAYHRVVLIFVDGIGLAPAGPDNPFGRVSMRALEGLLGGPLTVESVGAGAEAHLLAIDANLGVEGLPQSATGQTALFTGVNASKVLGHHSTGLPGPRLRSVIDQGNLFSWVAERGKQVTFANSYTPAYLDAIRQGSRRPSVTTCALLASSVRPREMDDLLQRRAVTWDVVRDHFRTQVDPTVPLVSPTEAGSDLAGLAADHHLTVYETFLTDLAGHRRAGFEAEEVLVRIDGLLAGLITNLTPGTTVILTSDHGNLEESSHRRHTRNAVPLLAFGPLADRFHAVESIVEITPLLVHLLTDD